jgi:hypothetical protein
VPLTVLGLPGAASAASAGGVAKVKVLGWGFDEPAGIVVDGQDVFVANTGGNTVTEFALPAMTLVRVLQGDRYHFSQPRAMALYGQYLWVLSEPPGTLSELETQSVLTEVNAATGQLVRVVGGASYGMSGAEAMTIAGPDIFVADTEANRVTEVDASTGRLVRLVSSAKYAFASPRAITNIGPDVFVANGTAGGLSGLSGTVTELDAATGALVQVISGAQYKFSDPSALATYGPDLFVFSVGLTKSSLAGSITEIDTGAPTVPAAPTTSTTGAPTTATSTTATTTSTTTGTTTSTTTTTTAPGTGTTTTTTTAGVTTTTAPGATTTTTSPPPTANLVRIISGGKYDLGIAVGASVVDNDLYVASLGLDLVGSTSKASSSSGGLLAGSVSEIDAQTGALVRNYPSGVCGIDLPYAVVGAAGRALVANVSDNTISELSAASGECDGATRGSDYQFDHPAAMVVAHGHLVVGGETLVALLSLTNLILGVSSAPQLTEINPSTGALTRVLRGAGYKFDLPGALAASGRDVYVADIQSASITEVNAGTGRLVRVIKLGSAAEIAPTALAVSGNYLLVGAARNNRSASGSLSEIDMATGRTLRTISGKRYKFGVPFSMATDGPDLFVDSLPEDSNTSKPAGSVLTEVDIASGKLVRVISGSHIGQAVDVVADGPYIFVVSQGSLLVGGSSVGGGPAGSLAQIDARTGAVVRVISGARYDLGGATTMVVLGRDLYIADTTANAVTEIDGTTGALVNVLRGSRYRFAGPDGEATWGDHLYVANGQDNTVTDIELRS